MGFFSSSTKDRGWEAIPLAPSQQFADQWLWDLLRRIETFAPREIAPMTPAERGAVGLAERTVEGGIPGLNQAIQVLTQRMTGDVEQVPGLKGLFTKTRELGSNLLGRTKRGLALTGNLPTESSRGEKIYGRTLQDIMEGLVTAAFPFYSQGLAAKIAAPGQLAGLSTADVMTRTGLGTTVGGLPRQIEQSVLDAILEAVRTTQTWPWQAQAPVAQNIMNQQRYAFNEGITSPSIFSQIANMVSAFRGGGTSPQTTVVGTARPAGGGGAGVPRQYQPSTQYGPYGAPFPS